MPSPVPPDIVTRLRAAGCVFAEAEARLLEDAAATPGDLAAMVDRRVSGEPLEHVLGWAEFAGLRVVVDPGVFVPRRRSELLVRAAVSVVSVVSGVSVAPPRVSVAPPRALVVDLCCGSGALGVAIVAALDQADLHAADIDPVAVRCARRNVTPVGGQVYEGDLYDALPEELRGAIDVLVANAPYVPTSEIGLLPPEARLHEARVALDGGRDGLDILRRVAAGAQQWLAPGGHLLVETSELQATETVAAFSRGGLDPRVARSDERDATVVIGAMPAKP